MFTKEQSARYEDDEEGDFVDDDEDEYEVESENDYACKVIQRKHESFLRHIEESEKDCNLPVVVEDEEDVPAKMSHSEDRSGAVLKNGENNFPSAQNISPILKTSKDEEYDNFPDESIYETGIKRKRGGDESGDLSLLSMDSSKKPKLLRKGSLTKTIKRRMSIGIVTPINNLFRQRRNSEDPNLRNCSTSTFNSTFNESIKEPIKEKFRQIKDKVSKLSRKDSSTPKSTKTKIRMATANLTALKDICTIKTPEKCLQTTDNPITEIFKTPKVPFSSKARPKLDETLNDTLNDTTSEKKLVGIFHTFMETCLIC